LRECNARLENEAKLVKRDMDIVRHLLLWVESDYSYQLPSELSREQLGYHTQILIDAGFVEGTVRYSNRRRHAPDVFHIQRLTWAGHDFLDAARNDTVWHTAREKVLKSGASWTFDLLKETLKALARQQLARIGLPELHT
jgi:hypothetical protein